jgi:ribonuclease D
MSTTQFMANATIHLHRHDLPDGLDLGRLIAVDTETMGLNPHRDRLCLVQMQYSLGVTVAPVRCTKIASRLVRTFTDRHGLKDLCKELLGVDLSKQQQTSDWGAPELTAEQCAYAASDVLYLHALWARLEALLAREGRLDLAEACFGFLPARCRLDLLGYEEPDIFHH